MQVLPEGQYIRHPLYGLGVITQCDAERTTVDFEDHGVKRFVTSLMSAEVVGEAPARLSTRRRKKAARS